MSDLVVFPEACVQGYTSLDWFLDRDIIESALKPLERIIPATKGLTAVVGTVRPTGAVHGRRLFNSAAVIRDGELLGFADKTLLPEYDVFDDPRYFQSGARRQLFGLGEEGLGGCRGHRAADRGGARAPPLHLGGRHRGGRAAGLRRQDAAARVRRLRRPALLPVGRAAAALRAGGGAAGRGRLRGLLERQ